MLGLKKTKKPSRNVGRNFSVRRVSTNNYYRPPKQPTKSVKTNQRKDDDKKSKRLTVSIVVNYAISIVIIGLVLFASTLSQSVDVKLRKDDYLYRTADEYAAAAKDIMQSSIGNKTKLTFRSRDFEEAMRLKFPEIREIDAIIPLGGRDISASIRVSEPLAAVSSGGESGVLDSSGVLVSTNVLRNSLLSVRFASPQSNFTIGAKLITSGETSLLKLLVSELENFSLSKTGTLKITEVLFNVGDGQLEVSLAGVPFYIKLSTYTNADEQIGAVKATLKQLDKDNSLPAKYIDARVPGRVFVI